MPQLVDDETACRLEAEIDANFGALLQVSRDRFRSVLAASAAAADAKVAESARQEVQEQLESLAKLASTLSQRT